MKTQLLIVAILIASAVSQGSYFNGQTDNLNLPSTSFSSSSSSSSSFSSSSGSGSGSSFGSSIQAPTFPSANLNSLLSSSTSSSVTNQNIAAVIRSIQNSQQSSTSSFDSLFTRFLTRAQLVKLVDAGDSAAILKTIQVVASDDSVPCGTKISYLLELMGIVKFAISQKSLLIDQLVTIVDGARAEINRLQNEINRLERDRSTLGIPAIQSRIADLISRLEVLYSKINAGKIQIEPESARIVGFENEAKTIEKQNDDERNRISNDKLKLVSTVNSIRELEGKIRQLRDTQNSLETSISRSEGIIRDNEARLNNIRNTIADIQSKIKGIQAAVDGFRRESNSLEVDLERLRSDLSVNQVKDNKLGNDIKALRERITVEQGKLIDDDLRNIRVVVDNLNRAIPQIQSAIDREYYYCYGAGKVQVETTGSTVVYVVRGDLFGTYVNSAYGQTVDSSNMRTDVRLQVVNPFDQRWTSKFGSSGTNNSYGSYSCMSSGTGVSGKGRISGISSSSFTINDTNGKTVTLNLAPCSRIESTSQMPAVGQQILWKGHSLSSGGSNQYIAQAATCY